MSSPYLAEHCKLDTRDLDEARETVGRLWEHHQSRLIRGRSYSLTWNQATLGRTQFSYIVAPSPTEVICGPVCSTFRLSIPEAGHISYQIDGATVYSTPDLATITAPGQNLLLRTTPFRALLFSLDADFVVEGLLAHERQFSGESDWPVSASMHLPCASALRELIRWAARELDRPNSLLQSSPDAMRGLEMTLRTLYIECLVADDEELRTPDLSYAQLLRIESWMDAHLCDLISIEDMARVGGVSARSVQMAFRRWRGCTPTQSLLRKRLEVARRRLSEPAPQETVTQIATDCSFFHFGRFAERYRQAYGETPSQTLARARGTSVHIAKADFSLAG